MGSCCDSKDKELDSMLKNHRNVLWIVLLINLVMFFIELSAGVIAKSLALTSDSLDMLGDTITYGSSIVVLGSSIGKKVWVARLKAWIMLIFGLSVSAHCIYRFFNPSLPELGIMFGVGSMALCANLICLALLAKHKKDDINMKSVWICSRNDIIANSSVLLAALVIYFSRSPIPDLIVGAGLAVLFTKSAITVFKDANQALENE